MYVSQVTNTPPQEMKNELQRLVYQFLEKEAIPFQRVDTGDAVTMDDCVDIAKALQCPIVKSLFLCNRQKTSFYLFITPDNKPFVTKNFGAALGVSRVSFAPEELLLEIMGTKIGATTVFSSLLNSAKDVRIVFDADVLQKAEYGCTDGTSTSYMKLNTAAITDTLLPKTGHTYEIIRV